MALPTLLLFDLGGVLVENAGFDRLNHLLREPLDGGAIRDRWLASPAVRAFERGRIAPEDFGRLFVREWDIPLSPDIFLAEFTTWPKGFHPQAPALLARLRARGRIACLSNSNALHWTRFGGFCEHFDVALSSHVLGVVKPDAEAFTAALETCGAAPHETLFFDDSLANVRAAERGGLRAVHVDGFDELLDALDRLGLNVEEDV